jgi:hypothetical protein
LGDLSNNNEETGLGQFGHLAMSVVDKQPQGCRLDKERHQREDNNTSNNGTTESPNAREHVVTTSSSI